MKLVHLLIVLLILLIITLPQSCTNLPIAKEIQTNYSQVTITNQYYTTNSISNVYMQVFVVISNLYIAPPTELLVYVYTNSNINSWPSPQLYYWIVGTSTSGYVEKLSNYNEFIVFKLTNIDFATKKVGIKLRRDATWSQQEPIKTENGPLYDRIISLPIYSITNSTTNSTTNAVSRTNYITNRITTIISSPNKIYVHSPENWWESFPYFFESETNLYKDPPTKSVFEWFGANYQGNGVTYFLFYGPNLRRVWVAGEFSGWKKTNMYLSRDRVWWWTILSNTAPGQKYKFVIEKYNDPYLHWISDPGAKKNIYSPAMDTSGNESIIIDHSSYTWQSSSWKRPGYEYYVIYQIHIRTFYTNGPGDYYGWGTFETAINRFDYLTNLGITAIEPLPINEFAGDMSWGYNYVLYYAPETAYVGTNLTTVNTFKKFVDEAHKRGMAVILDLVFNHIGPGDDIIASYDPAVNWENPQTYWYSGKTPWGPSFNYSNPIVRKFLIDSAKYFMKFYKIDGFRFDATYFIAYNNWSSPGGYFLYELGIQLRQFATNDGNGPNLILIAENLPNWNWITDKNSGRQDAQWNVELAHELKKLFYSGPGILNMNNLENRIKANDLDNGFNNQNPHGLIAIQYLSSHDEVANGKRRPARDLKDRTWGNDVYDAQYQTLTALATAIFARGIPMIFMGDEILEGYFPGDQEWFRDDVPINWAKLTNSRVTNTWKAVRDLIRIRKERVNKPWHVLITINHNPGNKVIGFSRTPGGSDDIYVIINYDKVNYNSYDIPFPSPGTWNLIYSSPSGEYGDAWATNYLVRSVSYSGGNVTIKIPEYGVLIYKKQ